MRSFKNYAIFVLAITSAVVAGIAWRQYQELIALRAAALEPIDVPAPAQTLAGTLSEIPVQLEADPSLPPADTAARPESANTPDPRRGADRMAEAQHMAMMDRPEAQRLLALQRRASLDHQYAELFRSLNLSPDQLEKFKDMLVDKSAAVMDVRAAARAQGIDPRTDQDAVRNLVSDARAEVDAGIRAMLGEAGFAQYQNFEKTQPQRSIVNQLEQRLSYSSTPLSFEQSNQLVNILAASSATQSGTGGSALPNQQGRPANNRAAISDTAVNQALGLLAGPQIAALKQLQQEQAAQAELTALLRRLRNEARSSGSASASAPATSGP